MTTEQDLTDDALMAGAAQGRTVCFRELFVRYRSPVFNYHWRMCGDFQRAEDLTQETFLAAYRAREGYAPNARFRAWLFRIATNLARSAHGARVREANGLEELTRVTKPSADPPGTARMPDAEQLERKRAVQTALLRLPHEERAVVVLRHYRGLKFREIAEVLDIQEATAKSRMRYGLQKLSRWLSSESGEPQ